MVSLLLSGYKSQNGSVGMLDTVETTKQVRFFVRLMAAMILLPVTVLWMLVGKRGISQIKGESGLCQILHSTLSENPWGIMGETFQMADNAARGLGFLERGLFL